MNREMNPHLNAEAMLRWHAGDATEAERAHAAACAECQAQTKPLADALQWFGVAAREWGDEKAATAQERSMAATAAVQQESRSAATHNWRGMAAAWAVVSVVLLLIFGIGLPRWKAHRAAMEAQVQQRQQQEEKQELARDNALLDDVDQDVSQVVPEAMEPLSWSSANNAASVANSSAARQ